MNKEQFSQAAGLSATLAKAWFVPMEAAMFQFAIVSPERAAAFIATCGHESVGFTKLVENLNYSEKALLTTFKKYYTPELARMEARKPILIANRVYGGRMGNTEFGDGWKYRGRALIQITGKDNYLLTDTDLGINSVVEPSLLEIDSIAAHASAAWWVRNGCNEIADTGDFLAISRKVNIGKTNTDLMPNGWDDRKVRYEQALKFL